MTGKGSFSDLINSMIADIMRLLLYKNVFQPLFKGIGGMVGLSTPVTESAPVGRDAGSTPTYSVPQITGIPINQPTGGYSSQSTGDSYVSITINNDGTSKSSASDQQSIEMAKKIEALVKDVMIKEKRAGGLLSAA
jgi:hypothetical protein